MNDTPNSELSVYFDAQTSIFDPNAKMESSQDIPPPVRTSYQLQDNPVPDANHYSTNETHVDQHDFTLHPNGSEGWLPAEDMSPANQTPRKTSPTGFQNNNNLGANVSRRATTGASPGQSSAKAKRSGSLASKRSAHATTGSAFVNGAGALSTTDSDEEVSTRRTEANASLTPKQRSKIVKVEAKDGRKLTKIMKEEAKTEKRSLSTAIEELAALQKLQKSAVKDEARVQANLSKVQIAFKKTEASFLEAKKKYETHQAELNAEVFTLETLRTNAREATEHLQEKSAEVAALRQTLAVDEREREVRLNKLKGSRSGFLWK